MSTIPAARDVPQRIRERAERAADDVLNEGWWSEHVIEHWKDKLARYGFKDAEISWSGFWSQGDGASFTCKTRRRIPMNWKHAQAIENAIYEDKAIDRLKGERNPDDWYHPVSYFKECEALCIYRRPGERYVHQNSTSVEIDEDMIWDREGERTSKAVLVWLNWAEERVRTKIRHINHQIYRDLEAAYGAEREYHITEYIEQFLEKEPTELKDKS